MSIAKNFTHMFIPYSFNDSIRPRQMTNSRLIAVLQVSDGPVSEELNDYIAQF